MKILRFLDDYSLIEIIMSLFKVINFRYDFYIMKCNRIYFLYLVRFYYNIVKSLIDIFLKGILEKYSC